MGCKPSLLARLTSSWKLWMMGLKAAAKFNRNCYILILLQQMALFIKIRRTSRLMHTAPYVWSIRTLQWKVDCPTCMLSCMLFIYHCPWCTRVVNNSSFLPAPPIYSSMYFLIVILGSLELRIHIFFACMCWLLTVLTQGVIYGITPTGAIFSPACHLMHF